MMWPGREFAAEELLSEEPLGDKTPNDARLWRVVRARNKWQPAEDCARHPVPGTYPVVITGEPEWGGWRVPGAEYDLDPAKMEEQARLIASAPRLAPSPCRWWTGRVNRAKTCQRAAELAHKAQDLLTDVKRTS